MKKIIVVLGAPYSGKDTHAKLLAQNLNYKYCSSNDIVAEEIKNKTKIGLIMEKYSKTETPAPDEYLIMLMKDVIINLKEDGVVFNNFPKTVNQAKSLDSFLFARKINRPIPVLLETDHAVIIKRMPKQPNKESSEMLRGIIGVYDKKIKPVVNYYNTTGLKFDTSTKSMETISKEILTSLKEKSLTV